MAATITLLIAFSLILPCFCIITTTLNGEWNVHNINKGFNITGTVPGSMYTAMLDHKMIDDPYYRDNDMAYRWIGRDDWAYSRTFNVTPDMMEMQIMKLICEGLDTIAVLTVNDHFVGVSDNMFVRYIFDIRPYVKVGENFIHISFTSAVQKASVLAKNQTYVIPPACAYSKAVGECHVNMIRKEESSFGWGFGPSFPTQGIWRDIYIESYNTTVIRYLTAETLKGPDGSWMINAHVHMDVQKNRSVPGKMEIQFDITSIGKTIPVVLTSENNSVNIQFPIPSKMKLEEWWPNGYGKQMLYTLYAFFTSSDGRDMSAEKIKIGFKTVELVQDYVSNKSSQGLTFYFKINGVPIFVKGSNWIPADSFQERVTKDMLQNLLQSARDVNINTLRVWGGGVYESEDFYDLADQYGIMIWQDLMFGCAMYRTDQAFLHSVEEEVTHQVRRLKSHASLLLWSGNNENEKALRQNWYFTDVNYTRYYIDYVKLYHDTMEPIVTSEDTAHPFITSSPTNGKESVRQGYVAQQPWSELYGDIHDYRYLEPFFEDSVYRIPRFASEYGYESLPSYETLAKVYAENDLDFWSDMSEHRQRQPLGNVQMMTEVILYLNIPNSPDKKQRFKDTIYVTQIDHAIGTKTETEHYRRWQNRLDSSGRGNTMGAMYWQLNDIWQGPTWASLEYGGKWKMLHYYARHFFAPLLISPYQENGEINVYICVDQIQTVEDRHPVTNELTFKPVTKRDTNPHHHSLHKSNGQAGTLVVLMYSWDNKTPLYTWSQPYTLNTTSELVFKGNISSMLNLAGCIRVQNCFLYFHLGDPVNGPVAWEPLSIFQSAIGLQKANIQITDVIEISKEQTFNVSISTDAIAPFVWLDTPGIRGRFSDNGFLMVQPKMTLQYFAWELVDKTTLFNDMTVKSLMDIYY